MRLNGGYCLHFHYCYYIFVTEGWVVCVLRLKSVIVVRSRVFVCVPLCRLRSGDDNSAGKCKDLAVWELNFVQSILRWSILCILIVADRCTSRILERMERTTCITIVLLWDYIINWRSRLDCFRIRNRECGRWSSCR